MTSAPPAAPVATTTTTVAATPPPVTNQQILGNGQGDPDRATDDSSPSAGQHNSLAALLKVMSVWAASAARS